MHSRLATDCVITDLCFSYPGRAVFNQFSAQLKPGLNWIVGDESSGKTTLVKLIAGQLRAQSGSITSSASQGSSTQYWIEPTSQEFDSMSATDFFLNIQTKHPFFETQLCSQLADELGLAPHLAKPLYMLSTGSKRKVFITAALACYAQIVLIDEPFAALDLASTQILTKALTINAQQQRNIIVLTGYQVAPMLDQSNVVQLAYTLIELNRTSQLLGKLIRQESSYVCADSQSLQ